jgi:RHS repeat-associated protein
MTAYAGDLSGGMDLGYTGKPYDVTTGLYNYGYRDYQPEAARFTTVDPVRDGANWYAYVNNDPVNYIDPWGLTPGDIFLTPADAVADFGLGWNGISIIVTPDGSLKVFDPITGETRTIREDMPSDPNAPNRKNQINPTRDTPQNSSRVQEGCNS